MTKKIEIKICEGKLEISREKLKVIDTYMICDRKLDLFIHADELKFGTHNTECGWLMFYNNDGTYVGSIWIGTKIEMNKVKQFLEETRR